MKKVILAVGDTRREANANEYPLRSEPKSDAFEIVANGAKVRARSTSGKGKSAVNNFYLYFVEGSTLYYVRSTPDEIARAKRGELSITDAPVVAAAVDTTPAPAPAAEPPKAEPAAPKRRRVAAKA